MKSLRQPFERQPHKMVKHTQTNRRLLPANCLSVFDQFVGLALKGLTHFRPIYLFYTHLKHPGFFCCFQRVYKWNIGLICINGVIIVAFQKFFLIDEKPSLSTLSITLIPSYSPCADYFRRYTLTYEDMTSGTMQRAKSNINAFILMQFRWVFRTISKI